MFNVKRISLIPLQKKSTFRIFSEGYNDQLVLIKMTSNSCDNMNMHKQNVLEEWSLLPDEFRHYNSGVIIHSLFSNMAKLTKKKPERKGSDVRCATQILKLFAGGMLPVQMGTFPKHFWEFQYKWGTRRQNFYLLKTSTVLRVSCSNFWHKMLAMVVKFFDVHNGFS